MPTSGWVPLRLREFWESRELLYFLSWRTIKIRYKQTALGASWAVLQPFMTMVVFTLFFGRLAKIPSEGVPYPIFAFAALVPWTFFSTNLANASNSLVASANLIRKVYFPRLVIPTATVLSGLVDMGLAFLLLLGMMLFYGISPSLNVLWLPLFVLLSVITSMGVALWLAAINVRFRDVRYVVPFLTQVWLFATPVAYPSSLLNEPWRTVLSLNPMTGVVEGFRWALLGTGVMPGKAALLSALVAFTVLIGGAYFFRRMERSFADVV
ncbi:MAG: ABC transporter permease [Gemmatimonadaceae bacterium]